MAMMVPMRRNRNLLSELMTDPFDAFFNAASAPMQKMSPTLMRTDIKETDAGFELTIDLPGFKKDDVQAELKDGYLTITAQTQSESEDKDEEGTYVRKASPRTGTSRAPTCARSASAASAAARSTWATTWRKTTSRRSSRTAC